MIATALYLGLMAIAYAISGKNPFDEIFIIIFLFVILIADFWLVVTKVMRNVEGN